MKFIFFLILVIQSVTFAHSSDLRGFKTDYCTNYPEGTRSRPDLWKHCCLMHDMFFWAGGTKSQRDHADIGLKTCIEETGETRIAQLMYWAVRFGSMSPIKYPDKKWNNGWPKRPDYQELSKKDLHRIEQEIQGYEDISAEVKTQFIYQLRNRSE